MTEIQKHFGGCHCGRVRFEVNVDLTQPAIVCNCSICGKTGTMLRFVPEGDFTLLQGNDVLTDYQFNSKSIHHLFCSTCGIRSFARGVDPKGHRMAAINVRCLDDIELDRVPTTFYDGKKS